MNPKKNLVLIPGLFRNEQFDISKISKLFGDCDVYICTNKTQKSILDKLNLKENIFYIEDDPFQKELESNLLELGMKTTRWDKVPGHALLQWHKLNYLVHKIGEKKLLEYENVFRFRDDLEITSQNLEDWKFEENEIRMNSDFCFGSNSKEFLKISNFFYSAISEYWRNTDYQPFNIYNIDNYDYDAAQFKWLKFPESVVRKDFKLYFKHRLELFFAKKKLSLISDDEIKKFVLKYKKEISDSHSPYEKLEKVVYFRKHQFKIFFPSEAMFLHYLLVNDFKIKKLFSEAKIKKL
tara:strand:+ start:149 stop:1030 length:882 start_codon:yes stop_codon:yes gene_type:complete